MNLMFLVQVSFEEQMLLLLIIKTTLCWSGEVVWVRLAILVCNVLF